MLILIAEDESIIRLGLKSMLEELGHQVVAATNGREAILFDRSIDVLVGRLRKRLRDDGKEPALIKTVRGEGYVLAASVEAL